MAEKLKPCPFCGERAMLCKDRYEKFLIQCSSCQLYFGIELEDNEELIDGWRATFNTTEEAIEAWNRRSEKESPLPVEYEGDGYDDNGELIYDTAYCPNCRNEYEVYYDNHEE